MGRPLPPTSPAHEGNPKSGWHLLNTVQLLVTVSLLWWLFQNPGRREAMWHAVGTADWRWMLASFASAGLCELFGILRWKLFLRMLHLDVGFGEVARLFFIGAFFNQFLPGTTGGDLVRVLCLMRDHPGHRTAGILSVAVDRLLAVLVLVSMGLGFAWWRRAWFATSIAVGCSMQLFAVVLAAMGAGLVASFILTSRHLVARLPSRFPMRAQIVKLSTLWQLCIANRREALLGALYTVPMLLAYFAAFCFAGLAFTDKVTFFDMTSILPLVTTISALPLSLNGIGVREALFERLLCDLCHVPQGTGLLVSISALGVFLVWALPGGVFYLLRIRRRCNNA